MSKIKPLHLRLNKDGAKIYDEDGGLVLNLSSDIMHLDIRILPCGFKEPHLYRAYLPVYVTSYDIEGHPNMGQIKLGGV